LDLKGEKETGVWRNPHNKELWNLYFASNRITSSKKEREMNTESGMDGRLEKCIQNSGWKM
jgi:hypothetical protein